MNSIGCAAGHKDREVVFYPCPEEIKPYSLEGKKNDFLFCVHKIDITKSKPVLRWNFKTQMQSVFFMYIFCWLIDIVGSFLRSQFWRA